LNTRSSILTPALLLFGVACLGAGSKAKAQTFQIQRIGLYDAIHTGTGGESTNYLGLPNAAGQATGVAYRYSGDSYNGDDTWFYSPATHTTQLIGLTDAAHTGTDGLSYNDPYDMNASGQVLGAATQFSGGTFTGQDAWLYSPTTNTTQVIGLTDAVHTQTDGSSTNVPALMNASGQVVGQGSRLHFDNFSAGEDTWIYSPITHTTQIIGLTSAAYTGPDGGPDGDTFSTPIAINAAGQVAGVAEPLVLGHLGGDDAWLYSPTTNTTQKIGFYDALHTVGVNGAHADEIVALNASGQVAGTANHFQNGVAGMLPYNGQDAWIYFPATHLTQQIGLVDAAHTQTGDYSYHKPIAINDAGQIAGYSSRFNGNTDIGQDAWLYASATNTTKVIGLTDAAHTQTGGYLFNQPNAMNAVGQVAGFAKRYAGSVDEGQDAWLYSPANNTTRLIGLTDAAHTRADGTSTNNTTFMSASGLVTGSAERYNANPDPTMSDEGNDSWLFDPASQITYDLVSSPSPGGFASSTVNYLGNDGTVLGSYDVDGGSIADAFLWTEAGGFHDLGDLIQGGLTAAGWANLADAYGADGSKFIVGDGTDLSGLSDQVYELAPVPEPFLLAIVPISVLGLVRTRQRQVPQHR
jgi:hypothetical protein